MGMLEDAVPFGKLSLKPPGYEKRTLKGVSFREVDADTRQLLHQPLLLLAAPLVNFAIAQASHRAFEQNRTTPWKNQLWHTRALRGFPMHSDSAAITAQTLREMDEYEGVLFATGMVNISEHVVDNADLVLVESDLKISVTESDDEGGAVEWEVREYDETGESEFAKRFSDPEGALAYARDVVTRHFLPLEDQTNAAH